MIDFEEVQYISDDNIHSHYCEQCKFYIWVDSGYGYCRRYPPKEIKEGSWWKPKYKISYQLVEWDRLACGEFLPKEVKK